MDADPPSSTCSHLALSAKTLMLSSSCWPDGFPRLLESSHVCNYSLHTTAEKHLHFPHLTIPHPCQSFVPAPPSSCFDNKGGVRGDKHTIHTASTTFSTQGTCLEPSWIQSCRDGKRKSPALSSIPAFAGLNLWEKRKIGSLGWNVIEKGKIWWVEDGTERGMNDYGGEREVFLYRNALQGGPGSGEAGHTYKIFQTSKVRKLQSSLQSDGTAIPECRLQTAC